MMKSIYSCATNVRIWIGEAADDSDDVMQTVQYISRHYPTGDRTIRHAFVRNIRLGGQCFGLDNFVTSTGIFYRINAFFDRAWWRRVWVLQEILLAKMAILHCGKRSLPLEDFFKAVKNIQDLMDDPLSYRIGLAVSLYFYRLISAVTVLEQLQRIFRSTEPRKHGSAALRMLALGWSFEATDPRDKIYGMFGMLEDLWCHVPVHYDWSVEKVYTHYALQILAIAQSLSIFNFTSSLRNNALHLPSWVPDWSAVNLHAIQYNRYITLNLFRACGDLSLSMEVFIDSVIKLKGIRIDYVISCGNVSGEITIPFEENTLALSELQQDEICSEWQDLCGIRSLSEATPYVGGGTKQTAFWRTVMNDFIPVQETGKLRRCRMDTKEDFERFLAWRTWLASTSIISDGSLPPPREIAKMNPLNDSISRRLIITETGYIGTGPKETQPGDVVYVLAGGKEPYILRSVPNAPQKPSFTLVGSSYLHGIMDGEATTVGWQAKRAMNNLTGHLFGGRRKRDKCVFGDLDRCHDVFLH